MITIATIYQKKIKVSATLNAYLSVMGDPLEQFEVTSVYVVNNLTLVNNLSLVFFFNTCLLAMFLASYNLNITNNYDFVARNLYLLVRSMVKENLYIKKQQYFAVLFYLFMTLMIANLVGLLPYSFTVTSSFIVTLFISLMHFVGVNIVGSSQHG